MDPKSIDDELFLNRFEPDGDDFIFRPSMTAPGVRVTGAERDQLIAERKKRQRRSNWIIGAIGVPTTFGAIAVLEYFRFSTAIATAAISAVMIAAVFIVLRAQTRSERRALEQFLKDRPTVVPGRTKEEARRVYFRRMTWTRLGTFACTLVVGMLGLGFRSHFLVWSNRYWIGAIFILFAGMFALGAYRKWRWGGEQ